MTIAFDLYDDVWPETFEGRTHILLLGGDGTINYFNKYPANTTPVSLIKGGTGSDGKNRMKGMNITNAATGNSARSRPAVSWIK